MALEHLNFAHFHGRGLYWHETRDTHLEVLRRAGHDLLHILLSQLLEPLLTGLILRSRLQSLLVYLPHDDLIALALWLLSLSRSSGRRGHFLRLDGRDLHLSSVVEECSIVFGHFHSW